MVDQYQDRPFAAADDDSRDATHVRSRGASDPLAELARLIGQTDPFSNFGRGDPSPRGDHAAAHQRETGADIDQAPPLLPWMQRANAHDAVEQNFQTPHPLQRYAAQQDEPEPDYHEAPPFAADADHAVQPDPDRPDPDRYDEALYGAIPEHEPHPHDAAQNDPYPNAYGPGADRLLQKRRGGLVTVALVLALAVVGTGAAFAYRTYVLAPRSGEPPVIKAETTPTKVVPPAATPPAAADAGGKPIQDRLATDAPEKIVSREEQPVNVQDATKAGPRVVLPPLNPNANPPAAGVAPAAKPLAGNGTLQGGDEPRKIRTLTVRGDQIDPNATPAAKQAPARLTAPAAPVRPAAAPVAPPASAGNAPLSLSPQAPAAEPRTRVASTPAAPQQIAPAAAAATGAGGYVVQVSSQRNEADAQASYRALQGKFPAVLGSRPPMIKRADLGDKGTYYRAMVGPFGSPDEATAFCGNLKTAGGQCVVQRN